LQWLYVDEYYLEPSNTYQYDGHELVNLAVQWQARSDFSLNLKVNNVTDELYAERATWNSFNDRYRFFPGRDRSVVASFKFDF